MNEEENIDRVQNFINANGGTRLIIGVLLFCLIQLAFLFNWLFGLTNTQRDELNLLRSDVSMMQNLLEENDLNLRLDRAEALNFQLASMARIAPTAGLAAADIQAHLNQSATQSDVRNLQAQVNLEEISHSEIVQFTIDLDGQESEPGDFARFLANLMEGPTEFSVVSLRWEERSGRFSMRLNCAGRIVAG